MSTHASHNHEFINNIYIWTDMQYAKCQMRKVIKVEFDMQHVITDFFFKGTHLQEVSLASHAVHGKQRPRGCLSP